MSDASQHEASLQAAIQHILQKLSADARLKSSYEAGSPDDIEVELRSFLEDNLEKDLGSFDVEHLSVSYLLDVLAEAVATSKASKAEVLESSMSLLRSVLRQDERVQQFLADFHALAAPEVPEAESLEATGEEIHTATLEKLLMSHEQATEVQAAWSLFLEGYAEDAAAEAVFSAFYESSPSLQHLFKTSRAVLAGRFFRGIQQLIHSLQDGGETKLLVEVMGFRHMDLEVTTARIACFREAMLDLLQSELGERFNTYAYDGLRKMFNYVGGGFIYVRENFKDRLEIISSSWAIANSDGKAEPEQAETEEGDAKASQSAEPSTQKSTKLHQSVPTSFQDMFCFNAAVMGLEDREWMYEILKSFDAIVRNVANSYRLQEECDVISLRFAKVSTNIQLFEFKALMLASLRSLVPKGWDSHHEAAWVWLWANVESILQKEIGKPGPRGRVCGRYVGSMESHSQEELSAMIYKKFFAAAPEGQDFFKQSSSRLLFIVHQIFQITVEMYQDPVQSVEQISALGLRHVGYGIPTEFFSPFVSCVIDSLKEYTHDDKLCEAFSWSLGLVSRILVRTITEGSTLVMKAINLNSAKHVKKALVPAPRKHRAMTMLKVTVGTQSISPLHWAIQSGSIDAARAILEDLLTIRADRERYYFGVNDLFGRHPDIVKVITTEAPSLLRVLVDRLVWRSRVVAAGHRRVNLYLEHLIIDAEGSFADAMFWIRKLSDPDIVKHVVLERLTDLIWDHVVYRPFLQSKVWLLFSLLVFLFSQSILKSLMNSNNIDPDIGRLATFACRCFVYMASLTELIYSQTKVVIKAIHAGDLKRYMQIPLPTKYATDWREALSMALALILLCMLWVEPILYCLQQWEGDFEGAGRFTSVCPQAADVQDFYSILSMFGMFCFFFLLVDFSALFVRMSAFVLMAARTLPELVLSLLSALFFVVVFSTAVTVFRGEVKDFQNVLAAMMTFFQISVGMYPESKFKELEASRWLLVMCVGFVVLVVVFLFNLLIAQLIGVYRSIHRTVVGRARLNRMAIICDSMPSVRQKVWRRFVESLGLGKRMEFGEGDVGLPGGIQFLEAANVQPTYEDSIRRFGGSTSPSMPWPEDEEAPTNSLEERLESLTRIFKKAVKKMNMDEKKRKGGRSTSSSSGSSTGSIESSNASE